MAHVELRDGSVSAAFYPKRQKCPADQKKLKLKFSDNSYVFPKVERP